MPGSTLQVSPPEDRRAEADHAGTRTRKDQSRPVSRSTRKVTTPESGKSVCTSTSTGVPSGSAVRISASAYWCTWRPSSSTVTKYAARLANVRATLGGQHETSNQGARREDEARALATSAGATAPGTRWCRVFV
ncbi:hypothetical protein D3C74_345760 [compost metagenome]